MRADAERGSDIFAVSDGTDLRGWGGASRPLYPAVLGWHFPRRE